MSRRIAITDTFHWNSGQFALKDSSKISSNKGVRQGKMVGFKLTLSNCTNAITATVKIVDSDGDVIYTSAGQNKGATSIVMGLDIPLVEQEIVRITPSGDPGASGLDATNVKIYYHPDPIIP